MDLADIWQEHKKFILMVVGCLVVLLVGKGVIGAKHDYVTESRGCTSVAAKLRKADNVQDRQVRAVREEVEGLRTRMQTLVEQMSFKADDLFVLPRGEQNPTTYCWNRIREMQDLGDLAERQDILVPPNLGLQDSAPADVEDVRRTLRALNIIQQILDHVDEVTVTGTEHYTLDVRLVVVHGHDVRGHLHVESDRAYLVVLDLNLTG